MQTYKIEDLYDGEGKELAQGYPEIWTEFLHEMEGRQYGKDALNQSWAWYIAGWLKSIEGFLGDAW